MFVQLLEVCARSISALVFIKFVEFRLEDAMPVNRVFLGVNSDCSSSSPANHNGVELSDSHFLLSSKLVHSPCCLLLSRFKDINFITKYSDCIERQQQVTTDNDTYHGIPTISSFGSRRCSLGPPY